MSSRIQDAAQLIAAARRSHVLISEFPGDLVPESLEEAYAIQDVVARDNLVYGWKVGPRRDGQEPRCAPLLGENLHDTPLDLQRGANNIDAVELEVFVKLKNDLPGIGRPYFPSHVETAIGSLHLGLELVGSRFKDRTTISQYLAIADNQSNGGAVLGGPTDEWQNTDLASLKLSLSIDGEQLSSMQTGASLDEIVDQVAWLANHTLARGMGLKAGHIIMTGARIGPVSVKEARSAHGASNLFAPVSLLVCA